MSTSPAPTEIGFRYGTSQSSLTNEVFYNNGISTASGNYSVEISGLTSGTTYYYQAFMSVWDGTEYKEIVSTVGVFTTANDGQAAPGYLGCYEVPAIPTLSGSGTDGTNSGRGDKWYRYYTTNSKQQVATHTFSHPSTSKQTRNYTVLYDGNRYAPLWVAYAMHATNWPDNGQTSGSWTSDPAIGLTQQTGLDNASSVGYSRGHMVSSQERRSSGDQNSQTYYYSNQAPQWQNSFNDGIWSTMEGKIVANAPSGSDTLYVVTGVLYEGTISTLPSASINVPIPSHFYKCLMKCSFNSSGTMTDAKGIAYVYTNEAHTKQNYYDSQFVTTIDAIEQRAGFDFFPNVPSSLQNKAESTSTALWSY